MNVDKLGALPVPTIILVGGTMALSDGSTMDSRQLAESKEHEPVIQKAVVGSWAWWNTVASVVMPILEGADSEAFARILGNRSVLTLKYDGSVSRRRLNKLLPGGAGVIEIARASNSEPLPDGFEFGVRMNEDAADDAYKDPIGYRLAGEPGAKWRFVGHEYYFTMIAHLFATPVTVLSNSFEYAIDDPNGVRFQATQIQKWVGDSDHTIVLPHTEKMERVIRAYLDWVKQGRPEVLLSATDDSTYDPDAPPKPEQYLQLVAADGDFHVTGWVDRGEWVDAGDLEAARALRESRYDLKLGLWDLARNPVLRTTLLEHVEPKPVTRQRAVLPIDVKQKAEDRVAKIAAERAAENELRETNWPRIRGVMSPILRDQGWITRHDSRNPGYLLSLTERMPLWPGGEERSLVLMQIDVAKKSTSLHVRTELYNDVQMDNYLAESNRLSQLEACSPSEVKSVGAVSVQLWSAEFGWGSDPQPNWHQFAEDIASRTPVWLPIFDELCARCIAIREQRFRETKPARETVVVKLDISEALKAELQTKGFAGRQPAKEASPSPVDILPQMTVLSPAPERKVGLIRRLLGL